MVGGALLAEAQPEPKHESATALPATGKTSRRVACIIENLPRQRQ